MPELMTKQEVAKELLKPYFDNPSLCSIDEGGECLYDGPYGKMCVFAIACTPEGRKKLSEWRDAAETLDHLGYGILQEKYRHIKDRNFWSRVQLAHDTLAEGSDLALTKYKKLTGEEHQRS